MKKPDHHPPVCSTNTRPTGHCHLCGVLRIIVVLILIIGVGVFLVFHFFGSYRAHPTENGVITRGSLTQVSLPTYVKPLAVGQVANHLPERLIPVVDRVITQSGVTELFPPLLFTDALFVPKNNCARDTDFKNMKDPPGTAEIISIAGQQICRFLSQDRDIGGKQYVVFRYGFKDGQTVLFGIQEREDCSFYEGEAATVCERDKYNRYLNGQKYLGDHLIVRELLQ